MTFLRRMNSSTPAFPPFAPVSALLHAAERSFRTAHGTPAVHAEIAGVEGACDADRSGQVARMDVSRQAVLDVVGQCDRLVLIGEPHHRQHRAENLFAGDFAGVVDVTENRWWDVIGSAHTPFR
jgi:hypothetical protein